MKLLDRRPVLGHVTTAGSRDPHWVSHVTRPVLGHEALVQQARDDARLADRRRAHHHDPIPVLGHAPLSLSVRRLESAFRHSVPVLQAPAQFNSGPSRALSVLHNVIGDPAPTQPNPTRGSTKPMDNSDSLPGIGASTLR